MTTIRGRITAITLLTAVGAATVGLTASPAAAGDDRIIRTGACSAGADWKLKVKTDNGRLEVEGEVDSNRNGQVWRWRIKHNGSLSAHGRATTRGPSGSFSVSRRIVNLAGTDHIVFRAQDRASGQVCRGRIDF